MEPLRILQVTTDYPPRAIGGIGIHVEQLTRGLRTYGFKVDVLCPIGAGDETLASGVTRVRNIGPDVPQAAFDPDNDIWSPLSTLQQNVALAAAVDRLDGPYDVVHCHEFFAAPSAVAIARRYAAPLVLTKHFIHPLYPFLRKRTPLEEQVLEYGERLQTWALVCANWITAVSEDVAEQLRTTLPDLQDRLTVVPPAIGQPPRKTKVRVPDVFASRQPNAFHILVPGRLSWVKGGDLAVLAAARMQVPDVHLWFAGEGVFESDIRAAAVAAGISNSVHFLGRIDGGVLGAMMSAVDLVLVPSRSEAFGLVVHEAQSHGALVVAARVGGIPDQVDHGVTGLLFEAGDVNELERCLNRVVKDPMAWKSVAEQGQHFASGFYGANTSLEKIVSVYRLAMQRDSE